MIVTSVKRRGIASIFAAPGFVILALALSKSFAFLTKNINNNRRYGMFTTILPSRATTSTAIHHESSSRGGIFSRTCMHAVDNSSNNIQGEAGDDNVKKDACCGDDEDSSSFRVGRDVARRQFRSFLRTMTHTVAVCAVALGLMFGTIGSNPLPVMASDSKAIVGCLFTKCQLPLLNCIANPKCLANVACINTCNGKDDEIGCQIKCGDLFENEAVGRFNKCAVSDMSCVPQQQDEGLYPEPSKGTLATKFDTKLWNGKWYITAGQNPLFDIFPCQVHFFTETSPGKFFGKLNWRIEEPDGEFFNRNAIQLFQQDADWSAHLINHDNEYLHYKDDWYIVDYEYDDNPTNTPPFAFVYYRGSNDAWDGYGGVVVYTRDAKLPESLLPRLRGAAKKVGYDFDKDFTITDNTCRTIDSKESALLKEKFAGKVLLQTEESVRAQATKFRGNAINSLKAQKIFFSNDGKAAQNAFEKLSNDVTTFEESFSK